MNLIEVGDKVRVFNTEEIEECMLVGIPSYHMNRYAGDRGFTGTVTHVDVRSNTESNLDIVITADRGSCILGEGSWILPEEMVELI